MTEDAATPSPVIMAQPGVVNALTSLAPEEASVPGPDVFDVAVIRRAECSVLALHGELDIASVASLELALAKVEADGSPVVILDLRRLSFMDCTGLRSLISARQRISGAGGSLLVVPGAANIHRLLELTGTHPFFEYVRPEQLN
ncbi:MAG TPA: STAS domain-containing protein [Actinomycetota bacterium]|nr:STAS domain-containing protein [Actinomycetota bacterium]